MPYLLAYIPVPSEPMLRGVNIPPATNVGAFWWWPANEATDFWVAKGADFVRIGFRWERMQPTLGAALDATHLAGFLAAVDYAITAGLRPIVEPHNFFGRAITGTPSDPQYKIGGAGGEVTLAHFVDLWTRLATAIGVGRSTVILGLMNEPESVPNPGGAYATSTEYLVFAYNEAIAAIRGAGLSNLIALEGNGWNNARFFATASPWYGSASGPAFHSGIVDTGNNWIADVHNYPDVAHGAGDPSESATSLRDRMANVIAWCISTGRKVIVGEWSVAPDVAPATLEEDNARDFIAYMQANAAHILGWCWWESRAEAQTVHAYNVPYDAVEEDIRIDWMGFAYAAGSIVTVSPSTTLVAGTSASTSARRAVSISAATVATSSASVDVIVAPVTPVLHLTASAGIVLGGDPNWQIETWQDQSPSLNHFTGYTGVNRPYPSADAFGIGIASVYVPPDVSAGFNRATMSFPFEMTWFACFKTTNTGVHTLFLDSTGDYLYVDFGVASFTTGLATLSGGTGLADGNPHTVAVTHESSGAMVLYVDGVSVQSGTDTYPVRGLTEIAICNNFNLRQIRAYTEVLNAAAILTLHNTAIADVTP